MKNPVMLELKEALLKIIEDLIVNRNATTFITGGALGADQAAFWCVYILQKKYPHIQNVVAIPYSDQGKKVWSEKEKRYKGWSDEQIEWYNKILQRANKVVYVDTQPNYQRDQRTEVGRHSGYKLQIRNEYMVDHADGIVAIWDGVKGKVNGKGSGTWNCLDYAAKKYPDYPVYHLEVNNHFHYSGQYKKASSL